MPNTTRSNPPVALAAEEPTGEGSVLFIRDFPPQVKANYKAYCAKRGVSMKEDIENYMRECHKAEVKKATGK